jgi:hypothetical protein
LVQRSLLGIAGAQISIRPERPSSRPLVSTTFVFAGETAERHDTVAPDLIYVRIPRFHILWRNGSNRQIRMKWL